MAKQWQKIQWPNDEDLTKLINLHASYTAAAKELNCNPESVRLRANQKKLNVVVKKKNYSCNEHPFLNNDALSYYLLGAYISDGNVEKDTNRISIVSADKEWMYQIQNIISPNSVVSITQSNAYLFRFSSPKIKKWMISNECIPNKSLVVKFPQIPQKYLRDFIRGIFDGDGSISTKFYENTSKYSRTDEKYCYEWIMSCIHSASESFIKSLSQKLYELNLKHTISSEINKTAKMKDGRIIQSKNRIFRITFSSKNAYSFLKWIYYSDKNLYLERKRTKAEEIFSYYDK